MFYSTPPVRRVFPTSQAVRCDSLVIAEDALKGREYELRRTIITATMSAGGAFLSGFGFILFMNGPVALPTVPLAIICGSMLPAAIMVWYLADWMFLKTTNMLLALAGYAVWVATVLVLIGLQKA